jgi:CBS domain-containing protein
MKAREVMSRNVVTVKPDASVAEAARLMSEKRISGLPVVGSDGKLLGVVSESDLLHRAELGTETRRSWWLQAFSDPDAGARAYAKAHGLKVRDVMSARVVSVAADAELAEVAAILDRNKIKRVPVLEGGALVGVITRADLVRALVQVPAKNAPAIGAAAALQKRIDAELKAQSWLDAGLLNVVVRDEAVELWGFVASQDQRRAVRVLVEEVSQPRPVVDRLSIGRPSFGAI